MLAILVTLSLRNIFFYHNFSLLYRKFCERKKSRRKNKNQGDVSNEIAVNLEDDYEEEKLAYLMFYKLKYWSSTENYEE